MRRQRRIPVLLLVFSVFFTLAALTGAQATGGTAGPRLLGRLAGALMEVERWVPAHREDLQAAARDRTRGAVEVEGLPLGVTIPAGIAIGGDATAVGDAIAAAAGRQLYDRGRAAFVDDQDGSGDISVTEPVRWAITLLQRDGHLIWVAGLVMGLVVSAVLALYVAASTAGLLNAPRLVSFGAFAFLLAGGGFWGLCRLAADSASAPVDSELIRILGDCAWMGVRNATAVSAASVALLLLLRLPPSAHPYAERHDPLDEPA